MEGALNHCGTLWTFLHIPGFNAGRFGVEMFFVLSGRLMAEILFINQFPLKSFFKRRITRVWPALFIFIIIMWLVFSFRETNEYQVSNWSVISALTFTYNYYSIGFGHTNVLDHIWSLCIEEHTYLLLGLIAFLSRKYNINPTPVLITIATLFALHGAYLTYVNGLSYYDVYWRSDIRSSSIIFGTVMFLIFEKNDLKLPNWAVVFLFFIAFVLNVDKVPDPIKYTFGSICIAAVVCSLKHLTTTTLSLFTNKLFIKVGLISFSLYLWQQPFHKLLNTYNHPIFLLAASFILAGISYRFIEVPMRIYLNKHWDR